MALHFCKCWIQQRGVIGQSLHCLLPTGVEASDQKSENVKLLTTPMPTYHLIFVIIGRVELQLFPQKLWSCSIPLQVVAIEISLHFYMGGAQSESPPLRSHPHRRLFSLSLWQSAMLHNRFILYLRRPDCYITECKQFTPSTLLPIVCAGCLKHPAHSAYVVLSSFWVESPFFQGACSFS